MTVTVRLAHADGSATTGAQLFVVRWNQTVGKGTLNKERLVPLLAGDHGDFSYTSDSLHAGDTLRLAARIGPDDALIHGSIEVR
jgi:hypothetical protein